jgi:hypothetical protein
MHIYTKVHPAAPALTPATKTADAARCLVTVLGRLSRAWFLERGFRWRVDQIGMSNR